MAVTEQQIDELEEFFNKATLPSSLQLDAGSKISDVPKFVQSHLNVLRQHSSAGIYEVFYIRLLQLKSKVMKKRQNPLQKLVLSHFEKFGCLLI